jgi:hypothetical protein
MPHTYAWIDGSVQSHMSMGMGTIQRGRDNLNLMWETGWERVEKTEYEIDATYSHYFNPRWVAFAGYRLTNMMEGHDAVIAGATYRLPYMVDFTTTLQSNGDARVALGKDAPAHHARRRHGARRIRYGGEILLADRRVLYAYQTLLGHQHLRFRLRPRCRRRLPFLTPSTFPNMKTKRFPLLATLALGLSVALSSASAICRRDSRQTGC